MRDHRVIDRVAGLVELEMTLSDVGRDAALAETLFEAGYLPYRAGIQSMVNLTSDDNSFAHVRTHLKKVLDPAAVLAPGRYSMPKMSTSSNSNQCCE